MYFVHLLDGTEENKTIAKFRFDTTEEAFSFSELCLKNGYNVSIVDLDNVMPF